MEDLNLEELRKEAKECGLTGYEDMDAEELQEYLIQEGDREQAEIYRQEAKRLGLTGYEQMNANELEDFLLVENSRRRVKSLGIKGYENMTEKELDSALKLNDGQRRAEHLNLVNYENLDYEKLMDFVCRKLPVSWTLDDLDRRVFNYRQVYEAHSCDHKVSEYRIEAKELGIKGYENMTVEELFNTVQLYKAQIRAKYLDIEGYQDMDIEKLYEQVNKATPRLWTREDLDMKAFRYYGLYPHMLSAAIKRAESAVIGFITGIFGTKKLN